MTTRRESQRNHLAGMAALALALAASACSDDPAAEQVEAEVTETTVATAEETDTASTDAEAEVSAAPERIVIEPGAGSTTSYVSSAMGGIRFDVPESNVVLFAGDHVLVTASDELERPDGFAVAAIGLTSMLSAGAPLESADAYLAAIRGAGVEVTPTGTTIEVLGYELIGYEMVGGSNELFLFASERAGAPPQSGFGPGANTIEFIADTPSGVLAATVADPDGEPEAWLPVLGTLLESLELSGPGLDPALPAGEAIEPADGGPPPPPAEGSDDPEGPPPLGQPFSELDPGRYELLNFGLPVSVDVPEDWSVQPNFPGVVVLTKTGSIGPGDRDIVWINDIRELAPIAGGPVRAGDVLPVDDIEAIITNPPAGLVLDNVERIELAGADGSITPVVSFDVSVDPSSACSPTEPCDYALVTSYGFVKQLLSTLTQRVWFFPDHPTGPAAAISQSHIGSDFSAEAAAVMATLELRS